MYLGNSSDRSNSSTEPSPQCQRPSSVPTQSKKPLPVRPFPPSTSAMSTWVKSCKEVSAKHQQDKQQSSPASTLR